ncbi:transposase [Streptomyces sp. NPDC001970]
MCADEFGPLNLMPRKGKAWGQVRRPRRLQATYHRHNGVRHMLAALDLTTGKLYYRIHPRERRREFLPLLKALRARRPGEKLYVVLDNFSPHKHAKVRDRADFSQRRVLAQHRRSYPCRWHRSLRGDPRCRLAPAPRSLP